MYPTMVVLARTTETTMPSRDALTGAEVGNPERAMAKSDMLFPNTQTEQRFNTPPTCYQAMRRTLRVPSRSATCSEAYVCDAKMTMRRFESSCTCVSSNLNGHRQTPGQANHAMMRTSAWPCMAQHYSML
jgi:hypothetical protein